MRRSLLLAVALVAVATCYAAPTFTIADDR